MPRTGVRARGRGREFLEQAPDRGYVFNLGHGVLPETAPESMSHIVELVRAHRPAGEQIGRG